MNEKESDGEAALLRGLPNEVVFFNVISRLPWYVRPVCRAVSKAWTLWIDTSTKRPDILFQSRRHLLPLLRSHFLVCSFDHRTFIHEACHGPCQERRSGYRSVHSRDKTYQICREWRELPSLQNYYPQAHSFLDLVATDGMVYVRASEEPQSFLMKMDLGGGNWTWKKLCLPALSHYDAVPFNRKFYFPNISVTSEERGMVVVHDMTTEEFGLVKTWNQNNLRVLRNKISESSSGLCEEELYSVVKHTAASESGLKLEILVYDACNDSWMSKLMLPMPKSSSPDLRDIKLANRDCFEPVPDGGINTVWIDYDDSVLLWFNSSLHETWVHFNNNLFIVKGKYLKHLQFIHGCLYGMFIEDEDDENGIEEETKDGRAEDRENKQDPTLLKWTIMKGKMVVETSDVRWEEVLDIGCFPDSYHLHVHPLDNYTFMA